MRRMTAWVVVFGLCGGCGDDGGGTDSASATEGGASSTSGGPTPTTGEATGTGDLSTGETPTTGSSAGQTTGTSGDTSTGAAEVSDAGSDTSAGSDTGETVAASSSGGGDSSTGEAVNQPPVWESEPGLAIILEDVYVSNFEPGQIFLASSRTDEIRVHDAESLEFLQTWTHPAFSKVNSTLYTYGPNGTAFNERGNLVVAAYDAFVEFSDHGVEYKVYPKVAAEATENIIFDALGNLYTTTATGGTDKLNQYSAKDYVFKQTIALPQGAGQLTGITFDGNGRLYVASQTGNAIHVSEVNAEFEAFAWVKKLSGVGNPGGFEGLQFNATGELVAAAGDLIRYNVETTEKIGTFDAPNDLFPVPLRVDNSGNIYTADYENGQGTAAADIFKFNSTGELVKQINDPGLFGPFGLAISGTVLAGDPPVAWAYELLATDPDGDPLTYTLVKGPADMLLDANMNILSWQVTSEDIGEYEIVLEVDDGKGGVTQQMFVLVVSAA